MYILYDMYMCVCICIYIYIYIMYSIFENAALGILGVTRVVHSHDAR